MKDKVWIELYASKYSFKPSKRRSGPRHTADCSHFAQRSLREIVFVELPEVGSEVKQMEPFGSVESVKAVSDLYSVVSGKVKEVNERVISDPSIVNRDPYGEGGLW